MIELQWVYEALGALVKEPTEENRKIVAEIICQELNDRRKETMRNVEKYICEDRCDKCKHCDSEGYCEVKRTYLIDLSYDGCDKWELED